MTKFSLEHFCEPLMKDASYFSKRMFGGLAVYYRELMRFCIVESPGDKQWRDEKYAFDIWNGVLLCTSREHHESLQAQWPSLVSHPVLGKWLYLPMTADSFESDFSELVEHVQKNDPRIGIVPGTKKRKSKKKKSKKKSR